MSALIISIPGGVVGIDSMIFRSDSVHRFAIIVHVTVSPSSDEIGGDRLFLFRQRNVSLTVFRQL